MDVDVVLAGVALAAFGLGEDEVVTSIEDATESEATVGSMLVTPSNVATID